MIRLITILLLFTVAVHAQTITVRDLSSFTINNSDSLGSQPASFYLNTSTLINADSFASKTSVYYVDTLSNQNVKGIKTFKDNIIISGKDLWITDVTGADSARIIDDGDTTRFTSDNPIKIGSGSLIVGVAGDIRFYNYPNTRDNGSLINILGTDASGNLISGPNEVIHVGGNFVDTIDQSILVVSTGQTVRFRVTKLIDNGISHTTDSIFTIDDSGVYSFLIGPQLAQGSGGASVEFWIEKNGVKIPNSNVQETIGANSESLPLLSWKQRFVATDTFKIKWASNSLNTMLDNLASTYGGPNIPAIMFKVTHIGH